MYSIKEVEKMYGLPASTLRFYERKGILPKINRDGGGRRKYTEQELQWLQLVMALRNTGMSIDEIKDYVALIHEGEDTLEQRRSVLLKHKEGVEKDMAQTFSYLEKINRKVAIYDAMIHKKNGGDILI
ncbi:MerR family transcriptional regulator [Bacillus megaterium]|uniref:MerR family transcriptional regulator n=1 Tax=Priestia megaterium TaxID=1404 RepID=UPI001293AA7E|nr:MerR family transcriptional regulator [Priestia megaterium]MQR88060.1 MerR family transcriptional regulator [Priestia megaterium]